MDNTSHEFFMKRCLKLASLGLGTTSPNPMVGAVIVHQNKIIGEGYHHKAGEDHAEILALKSMSDHSLLPESTLFVNLEPCAHFGKTPPCTGAIIEHNIPRVVVCNRDPNPQVSPSETQLHNAGVTTTYGILEKEGRWLNRRFFTFFEKKRPYIILKWAQSADGFTEPLRATDEEGIIWISSPQSKNLVHQWRAQEDSILVGANTAHNDDPELTVRNGAGRNPLRILIDPSLRVHNRKLITDALPTVIVNTEVEKQEDLKSYWKVEADTLINDLLDRLTQAQITSMIVEGGSHTIQRFVDNGLWDEARIIVGQTTFGKGLPAPTFASSIRERFVCGTDRIEIHQPL